MLPTNSASSSLLSRWRGGRRLLFNHTSVEALKLSPRVLRDRRLMYLTQHCRGIVWLHCNKCIKRRRLRGVIDRFKTEFCGSPIMDPVGMSINQSLRVVDLFMSSSRLIEPRRRLMPSIISLCSLRVSSSSNKRRRQKPHCSNSTRRRLSNQFAKIWLVLETLFQVIV